jgi:hypothetical protein
MKESRATLINDLAGDLKPVRRPGRTVFRWLLWLGLAGFYSIVVVLVSGTSRDGALSNLLVAPSYALEILAATVAIGLLSHAALRTAIPDGRSWPQRAAVPLTALGAWLALIVWGLLVEPALPASMLDKRAHCFWQTTIFSVPSFVLLLFLARGLMPLWPRATAALAGAAAAALPALLMQLTCMYEPAHALTHHLSPVAILAAAGALLGPRVLERHRLVPRRRTTAIH